MHSKHSQRDMTMNRNMLILLLFLGCYAMDRPGNEEVDKGLKKYYGQPPSNDIKIVGQYAPYYVCLTCKCTTVFLHLIKRHLQKGHNVFKFIHKNEAEKVAHKQLLAALS